MSTSRWMPDRFMFVCKLGYRESWFYPRMCLGIRYRSFFPLPKKIIKPSPLSSHQRFVTSALPRLIIPVYPVIIYICTYRSRPHRSRITPSPVNLHLQISCLPFAHSRYLSIANSKSPFYNFLSLISSYL